MTRRGQEKIEHDSAKRQRIRDAVEFSARVGGVNVSQPDMGILFRVIARGREECTRYSLRELLALDRLGVDPTFIPYAFQAVPAKTPPVDIVVSQFYNGVAKSLHDLEQAYTRLPSNMDDKARETAQILLRRELAPSLKADKVDTEEFILGLNFRSEEMLSQGDQKAEGVSITETDVLDEYLGLLLPPFKDLLQSSVVRKTIDEGAWDLTITLNPKVLAALPSREFNDVIYGVRIIHGIEINGNHYLIDGYAIRHGNFMLRLNGNDILPRLCQDRI